MKFSIGSLVITKACKAHMDAQYVNPMKYVLRHVAGDWGDLGAGATWGLRTKRQTSSH